MRKRRLFAIIVVIVGLLTLAWLYPNAVYVPVGYVKGEATFDGKPTDYWVHALNQEGFFGQAPPPGDAGKTLRQGGSAAVPVLCEIAQGPDKNLRLAALNALALMGAEAKTAKPMLQATVKTETDRSRFYLASDALAHVDAPAAADASSAILRDKQESLSRKTFAFAALLRMVPQGQEAVPTLKEVFNDTKEDVLVRVLAAEVLWSMNQPAESLLPALREMVTAENCPVGVQALVIMGSMGPAAKSALPTLLKVADRPNLPLAVAGGATRGGPANRKAVYRTLGFIGPDASVAIPRLLGTLQSNKYFAPKQTNAEYYLRAEIGLALVHMGPAGRQAVAQRDAVWGASITLLAGGSPSHMIVPSLSEMERRVWIPRQGNSSLEIERAIIKVDPFASWRAGLPSPVPADENQLDE
jgi:HEAT repeat protein